MCCDHRSLLKKSKVCDVGRACSRHRSNDK